MNKALKYAASVVSSWRILVDEEPAVTHHETVNKVTGRGLYGASSGRVCTRLSSGTFAIDLGRGGFVTPSYVDAS